MGVTAWTDGLAASSLGVPLLLTRRDDLPAATADELRRLRVTRLWVVGGTAAVGTAVRTRLRTMGITLVEVAGNDRYETAGLLAERVPATGDVVVASGESWADAASIGAWAGARRTRVYLTRRDSLPAASSRAREASRTVVVGGDNVVGSRVVAELNNPVRLAGVDRYGTNAAVVRWTATQGLGPQRPVLAPGTSPMDALVAAPLAASRRSVLVLTSPTRLARDVQPVLVHAAAVATHLAVVGGTAQIGAGGLGDAVASLTAADLVVWANDFRRANGRAPLTMTTPETERAINHALAQARQGRMFHQPAGCGTWGEALGTGEPRAVFDSWTRSSSHRSVLLLASATRAGAAVVTAGDGRRWIVLDVCA